MSYNLQTMPDDVDWGIHCRTEAEYNAVIHLLRSSGKNFYNDRHQTHNSWNIYPNDLFLGFTKKSNIGNSQYSEWKKYRYDTDKSYSRYIMIDATVFLADNFQDIPAGSELNPLDEFWNKYGK